MKVELVRATVSDGVQLSGALAVASSEQDDPLLLDAVICLHGVASNFYAGGVLECLGTTLLSHGVSVLRVNTRGHDGLTMLKTATGAMQAGAAYEVVDECRHDIDGWIKFLEQRGNRRVGLIGHSLGAIKSVYHEARQPHAATCCVVALSPPRLSHDAFQNSTQQPAYFQALDAARQLVEQDAGAQLIRVSFPFPMHIAAAAYIDKYGPGERYNIVRLAPRMRRPALFTYGSRELDGGIAFAGLPETLRGVRGGEQILDVAVIEGADHMYREREPEVACQIVNWLRTTLVHKA